MLATGVNDDLKTLHDRMPAVLPKAKHALWLDASVKDGKTLLPLLRPAPDETLTYYAVTPRVNSWKFDEPAGVEPLNESRETSS